MTSILLASATVSRKHTPTSEIEDSPHFGETPMGISAWTVAPDHSETKLCEFESYNKGSQLLRAASALQWKTTRLRKRFSKRETASLTKSCTMSFIEKRVDSSIRAFDASADGC